MLLKLNKKQTIQVNAVFKTRACIQPLGYCDLPNETSFTMPSARQAARTAVGSRDYSIGRVRRMYRPDLRRSPPPLHCPLPLLGTGPSGRDRFPACFRRLVLVTLPHAPLGTETGPLRLVTVVLGGGSVHCRDRRASEVTEVGRRSRTLVVGGLAQVNRAR